MTARFFAVALCAGACAVVACGDKTVTATQVMVAIDAESGVRLQTHDVHVRVRSGQGEMSKWEDRFDKKLTPDTDQLRWPLEFALLPKTGDATRVYEVTATALDAAGKEIALVRAISGYRAHRALLLRLRFDDACIGKVAACDDTETCKAGKCVDAHVNASLLPPYSGKDDVTLLPGDMDGGPDASQAVANDGGGSSDTDAAESGSGTGGTGGHGASGAGGTRADAGLDAPFEPSNIDVSTINFGTAPSAVLDCGDIAIDTSGSVTFTNWCGDAPIPEIRTQLDGTEFVVLPLKRLTVKSGALVQLAGSRAVAFVVDGDVTIAGTIDASARGGVPGAGGGNPMVCMLGNGRRNTCGSGAGAGGGGGFGSAGGTGGAGLAEGALNGVCAGGSGGAPAAGSDLAPLRGGCNGATFTSGTVVGAGGGAIQISAKGNVTIATTGLVLAVGGGAENWAGGPYPGLGGGSGGAVLVEAANVTNMGAIRVHGGGGRAGGSSGGYGEDGHKGDDMPAIGGSATDAGKAGNGGRGGVLCIGAACAGTETFATNGADPVGSGYGGGGGGGYGRIVIR